MDAAGPAVSEIRALSERLQPWLVKTPVVRSVALEEQLGGRNRIYAKLEFLQQTGTFKARGALSSVLELDQQQLRSGVTAVSAGNHAIATAFAARSVGTSAKVLICSEIAPNLTRFRVQIACHNM